MILSPATQLWDRDEPLYARAAVEMLRSGHWLVPTFDGSVFADKPPLIYWLMAASVKVFGVNEFAFRFVSCVSIAASALLTFLIARRLFDDRTGLWAMAIFATTTMSVYLGAAAMLDAALLAFILLAFWAYVEIRWADAPRTVFVPLFGVALALSMLTKGPVGPAVVGAALLSEWVLSSRGSRPTAGLVALLAVAGLFALGAFLAWAVPANTDSGGAILRTGLLVHVIGRALAPMQDHGGSGLEGYLSTLFVYVPVIVIGMLPWSTDLPAVLATIGRRGQVRGEAHLFLWSWAISTFVLFTIAATKLPHYVFPLFPALAIEIAAFGQVRQASSRSAVLTAIGDYGQAGFMAVGVVGLVAAVFLVAGPAYKAGVLLTAAVAAVATVIVFRLRRSGQLDAAWRLTLVTAPIVFFGIYWLTAPGLEPEIKISKAIALSVAGHGATGLPVFTAGYSEPSLDFYLNHPPGDPVRDLSANASAAVAELRSARRGAIVVATEDRYRQIAQAAAPTKLVVLSRFEAYNLNEGAQLQTVVVAAFAASPGTHTGAEGSTP